MLFYGIITKHIFSGGYYEEHNQKAAIYRSCFDDDSTHVHHACDGG
jgi:hypothetical protein